MRKYLIFAMLAMLVAGPVLASKPSTPVIGEMYGNDLHGTSVSPVQWGVVTGNLSGQTQFACSYLDGRGDDAYNLGWKVYILTGGTNTTAGTVVDVTDYVSATGTFTTVAAGANYDTGDPFLLVFGQLGKDLESGNTGGMTFQAKVSSLTGISGAADSFYVENFIGYGNDRWNKNYYIEVTQDAGAAAPECEIKDIEDYVSSTGLIVCDAFSAALAVGDVVTVMHESVCWNMLPGRLEYSGKASIGAVATPTDSFYVASLIGFGNDFFNESDFYAHVINTTDGAAPIGETALVLDYVSATGLFTVSGVFSASITASDYVSFVHSSIAGVGLQGVLGGESFKYTSATAHTSTLILDNLIGTTDLDLLDGGGYALRIDQADGAAPEGEIAAITAATASSGTITCTPAFSANVSGGDYVSIIPFKGNTGSPVTITNYDQPIPASAVDTLMVFRGPWVINEVIGQVTTVIGAGTNSVKLSILNSGTTTDICANLDIDADVDNSWYVITGTLANAMVNSAVKVPIAGAQAGAIRLAPGTNYLVITATATTSGEISWSVNATPLNDTATANAFTVE